MPNSQATAVVLFWAQVVSGLAATIYIGQWRADQNPENSTRGD